MRDRQVVEALARQRAHQDPVGVAVAQLVALLGVERVDLVEHEQPRAVAGADLLEHVLDGAQHLQAVVLLGGGVDARAGPGRRSVVSSSVAPKASTSWWGSLRMKPTVSVSRYGRPSIYSWRVVGSSVWNSRSRTPTSAPVSALSSVDLPAFV